MSIAIKGDPAIDTEVIKAIQSGDVKNLIRFFDDEKERFRVMRNLNKRVVLALHTFGKTNGFSKEMMDYLKDRVRIRIEQGHRKISNIELDALLAKNHYLNKGRSAKKRDVKGNFTFLSKQKSEG